MNILNQNIGHDTDKLSPIATNTDTSHHAQIVLEEKRNQALLLPCPDGPQEKLFLLNEKGWGRKDASVGKGVSPGLTTYFQTLEITAVGRTDFC